MESLRLSIWPKHLQFLVYSVKIFVPTLSIRKFLMTTDLFVEFPGEREVAGARGDLHWRVVLLEAQGNVAALAGVAVHPDASCF
jgi:hypothetical protein